LQAPQGQEPISARDRLTEVVNVLTIRAAGMAFLPYSYLRSQSPPVWGREPNSREAVLLIMYRVKGDGLQGVRRSGRKTNYTGLSPIRVMGVCAGTETLTGTEAALDSALADDAPFLTKRQ
jgi:hypothetical protein